MPIPLINSIASWVLKQRIHQIELFLKYPHEVQEELMMNLIRSSEETVIGQKYDFGSIKSYQTFAERVPIATYEDLEPMIELTRKGAQNVFWNTPIKWFAKSSGTTTKTPKCFCVKVCVLAEVLRFTKTTTRILEIYRLF